MFLQTPNLTMQILTKTVDMYYVVKFKEPMKSLIKLNIETGHFIFLAAILVLVYEGLKKVISSLNIFNKVRLFTIESLLFIWF